LFPAEKRATQCGLHGRREAAFGQGSTFLLPIDDAEHQLQVLSDARSPAALQLLGYASAAQRAAGVSRLVLHALVRFLRAPIRGKRPFAVASRLVDLGEMGRDQELHHALRLCSGRREFTGMELKRPL
jgi:hypothetical protein